MEKLRRLDDVVVIRLLLMLLVVLYHAFCPAAGIWKPIDGMDDSPVAYWWIAKFSSSFVMETFVFISGYLFGYQMSKKSAMQFSMSAVVKRKAKRLVIPSIIFSVLYLITINNAYDSATGVAYGILNGVGHMWFLPMLFWCFVFTSIAIKFNAKPEWVFALLIVLSLFSFVPLPFRISSAFYYMLFFYVGYWLKRYEIDIVKMMNIRCMSVIGVLYLFVFVGFTLFNKWGGVQRTLCQQSCREINAIAVK